MEKRATNRVLAMLLVMLLVFTQMPVAALAVYTQDGVITAFAALPEDIRFQRGTEPDLPDTVEGTVDGETVQIPVTWEAESYDAGNYTGSGLFAFSVILGEGYILAEGVSAPTIAYFKTPLINPAMGGLGTQGEPLEIVNAAQLAELAALVNAGKLEKTVLGDSAKKVYIKLMNNIDLSAYGNWTPIGTSSALFKGQFDGGGNTISGLYINRAGNNYAGLFGTVESGAAVNNVGLVNVNITGKGWVGGVAGAVLGTVENCYVTGSVTGTSKDVGGVAGSVSGGTVKNCYATANVTGREYTGGVAGYVNGSGKVENCYSTGSVTGTTNVGGVAGTVESGTVQNCAALNPSVSGTGFVGRVIGDGTGTGTNYAFDGMTFASDGTSLTADEIATGTGLFALFTDPVWICAPGRLPGLFNALVPMPVHMLIINANPFDDGNGADEYNAYKISTAEQLAWLAERVNAGDTYYNENTVFYQLTADIDLSAYNAENTDFNDGKGWIPIGTGSKPFKGQFDGDGHTISGLDIDSTDNYIGLFGYVDSGAVVRNLGVVDVNVSGTKYVGSVAGYVEGTVENCCATGNVIGTGAGIDLGVGGVTGSVGRYATLEDCYSTSRVIGGDYVGGVTGSVGADATLENCYATGGVTGGTNVGGVTGSVGVGATVQNCAALNPSVSGTSNVGRVIGKNAGTGTNNYAFDGMSCTSSGDYSDNGTPKDASVIARTAFWTTPGNWGGTGWSSVWTIADNRLPGLFGKAVTLPSHLRTAAHPFDGGDGTSGNPYEISTAEQLAWLAEKVNDTATNGTYGGSNVCYILTADIDLSGYNAANTDFNGGKGWIPIGISNTNPFKGKFDGSGKTISGLYINSEGNYIGLFGYVGSGASVQNLGVVNASVTGTGNYVGGVAGFVYYGTVQSCYVTGNVKGNGCVGGVAGYVDNTGIVQNCYATGSVTGTGSKVGGVAGEVKSGTVQNCYATNSVSGSSNVGGVAGIISGGTVKNCTALNDKVSGTSSYVGRVIGSGTGTNNYAYSGMECTGKDGTGKDGTDMSAFEARGNSFWADAGNWDSGTWNNASIWTKIDTKLPVLTGINGQSGDSGIYLTPKTIKNAVIGGSIEYTGEVTHPTVTLGGVELTYGVDFDIADYTSTDGGGTSAGIKVGTVTAKINGMGNYTGEATGSYEIRPKDITGATVEGTFAALTYTGLAQTPSGVTVKIDSLPATGSWSNVTNVSDTSTFTASGNFTGTITRQDVGMSKVALTVTAETKSATYGDPVPTYTAAYSGFVNNETTAVISGAPGFSCSYAQGSNATSYTITPSIGTLSADNYTFTTFTPGTLTVAKAAYPGASLTVSGSVRSGTTTTDATLTLPTLPDGASYPQGGGTGALADANLLITVRSVFGTKLTYSTDNKTDGTSATITFTITNATNYNSFDVVVTITALDKVTPTGTPTYTGTISYGQALGSLTLDVTMMDGTTPVAGTIEWDAPATKPAAGTASQSWTFTPTNTTDYAVVTGTISVTVGEATPSGTPAITAITESGKTLADANLTGSFANPNDGSAVTGTLEWDDGDSEAVTANTAYGWTFTPTGADAANYNSVTGTLTPYMVSTGGGGGGAPTQTIPANDGAVTVGYTQTGGTATLDMPDSKVTEIIGKAADGVASLDLTGVNGATSAEIPLSGLSQLADAGLDVELKLPQGTVTLDADAAASAAAQAGGNITISLSEVSHNTLTPEQQATIGATDTVLDITMTSGSTVISNFDGTISVTVPYTGALPAAVWYLNDAGELEKLTCTYDAKTGTVTFTTDHLSLYVLGKDSDWINPFTDVKEGDWFYGDVEYVYARGLMNGVGNNLFSPQTPITRGMIVTILWRANGEWRIENGEMEFGDVLEGAYYYDAVMWAADNGIVEGYGDSRFGPDDYITRQDLAVILWRYAKFAGIAVSVGEDISAFGDALEIAEYAIPAMQWAVGAGIITGKPGGLLDPQGTATRAEAAAMLHRFLENTAGGE